MASPKDPKIDLTDIGGKCPNCGAEDMWLVLDRQASESKHNYDVWYNLECQGTLTYDPDTEDGIGEIVACKYERDITICEEPEWERPDDD